jgi:hypothetical protein
MQKQAARNKPGQQGKQQGMQRLLRHGKLRLTFTLNE